MTRFDIVDQSQDDWTGMPTQNEMQITLKGFLFTMFVLWVIFGSVIGMVLICKAIF